MSLFGISVLIIEDDEQIADLIQKLLVNVQPTGWSVNYMIKHVETLGQAKKTIKAGGWDVILLDLKLPNGEGLAVFRECVAIANAPIIILTGAADLDTMQQAIREGAARYFEKRAILATPIWLHYSIAAVVETWRLEQNVYQMQQKLVGELRNMITACSGCQKWRDPVSGVYLPHDKFLEKFDIRLTHGICPDCASSLYMQELNATNQQSTDE